jgi:glycosyltransferase involved in cell wall biosynthesis
MNSGKNKLLNNSINFLKRILFITYYWPPSGGAGVQRSVKFVKYLPESAIEPVVLTVDEKYASYPLIDQTLKEDLSNEVKVIKSKSLEPLRLLSLIMDKKRIPHGGFANSNKEKWHQKMLRYIRGNFFLPDARVGWVRFAVKAADKIIREQKIDTIVITSPPHSSQLIGLELKKRHNIRWIADLRDPWTDIYYYNDMLHTGRSAAIDKRYEMSVLQNADEIITVSDPINQIFLRKSSALKKEKFHVIPNGFDENDFAEEINPPDDSFLITYVGTIADSYNPEVFFRMFKKLIEEFNDIKFGLRIVGSLPGSIRELVIKYNLDSRVEYVSHVSHKKAVEYMMSSTSLLLIIPDVEGNEGILTGKLFEYLAARRPIIGIGPVNGSAAEIINECSAGKMFSRDQEEENYSYLKSLVLQWKEDHKIICKSEAYRQFSRSELTKKLASIILNKS